MKKEKTGSDCEPSRRFYQHRMVFSVQMNKEEHWRLLAVENMFLFTIKYFIRDNVKHFPNLMGFHFL